MKLFLALSILLSAAQVHSHGTEVRHCIEPSGKLRIFVEHWHGDLSDPTTAGTMQIDIDGVVSTLFPIGTCHQLPVSLILRTIFPI